MDGQIVLQVSRLLRLSPGGNQVELNKILSGLTPPQRSRTMQAARAINQGSASFGSAKGDTTIGNTLAAAGWNVKSEGTGPSGGALITVRVPVKIITPDGTVKWRTIKEEFPEDMTLDEILDALNDIGDDWGDQYEGSSFEIITDSLLIF